MLCNTTEWTNMNLETALRATGNTTEWRTMNHCVISLLIEDGGTVIHHVVNPRIENGGRQLLLIKLPIASFTLLDVVRGLTLAYSIF